MSDSQPSEFLYFVVPCFFVTIAVIGRLLCNRLCSSEARDKKEEEETGLPFLHEV